MLRTLLRAMLVAAIFATLLVPATPAAAAETTYTMTTVTEPFKRGTQTYQLSISATQHGGEGDSMTVTIAQVVNPRGVAYARREVAYSWFFNGDRFVPLAPNATSTLKTSAEMGDYGNVAVTLKKTSGPERFCNDTIKQWSGPLSGTVTLDTGTDLFGTVQAVPTHGTLTANTGFRCYEPGHPSNMCPEAGFYVGGYRFPGGSAYSGISASRPNDTTKPATFSFYASQALPAARTNADGHLGRMLTSSAPRTAAAIATGLATATLDGDVAAWVSGQATFTANEPAGTGTPYPCAGGMESVSTYRSGTMSGGFAGDMLVGSNVIVGQNLLSSASKTIVRAR